MLLKGSCYCGAVRFSVHSRHPYPFMYCYCSICRKLAGAGGYGINLSADKKTLEVGGEENITIYRTHIHYLEGEEPRVSNCERSFCRYCGSCLWVYSPHYPELLHPFASAIDTDLPSPPEQVHIFLDSAANWVKVPEGSNYRHYRRRPQESIAQWHDRLGLADSEDNFS